MLGYQRGTWWYMCFFPTKLSQGWEEVFLNHSHSHHRGRKLVTSTITPWGNSWDNPIGDLSTVTKVFNQSLSEVTVIFPQSKVNIWSDPPTNGHIDIWSIWKSNDLRMISQGNHGCSIHVYNLSLLTMRGLTKFHYKIGWMAKTSLVDLTISTCLAREHMRKLSWNVHRHSYFLWFVNDKFSMCKSRGTTDPYTVAEWCFCLWMYHEVPAGQRPISMPCRCTWGYVPAILVGTDCMCILIHHEKLDGTVMMCKRNGKTGLGSFNTNMLWNLVSHMLHVWNIYECLPTFTP